MPLKGNGSGSLPLLWLTRALTFSDNHTHRFTSSHANSLAHSLTHSRAQALLPWLTDSISFSSLHIAHTHTHINILNDSSRILDPLCLTSSDILVVKRAAILIPLSTYQLR